MSDISDFARRIPGFDGKAYTDKIEIFAWYLHQADQREKFQAVDILKCFDAAHCAKPVDIHSLLRKLCEKKPPRLLKDAQGYRLSHPAREHLDRSVGTRGAAVALSSLLSSLVPKVKNPAQLTFLNETLICFSNKAYRAAIVMAWNLAFSHVCDSIFEKHLSTFNEQRNKVFPKLPELKKRTDFEDYKESQVIEICRGARILDSTVCKTLTEKLGRRNTAAHPSSAMLTAVSAEELIVDLVLNVLLNEDV